jgi:hypothetical protein
MGSRPRHQVREAAPLYAVTSLPDALFSTTQQRVLGRLFCTPGVSLSVSELIEATGAGSGAVQREIARLVGSGVLAIDRIGRQKRYRANPDCPIHHELVAIVGKTLDPNPQRPLSFGNAPGDSQKKPA